MKINDKKLILRKESFGGIFADTDHAGLEFLRPEDYEAKRIELMQLQKDGRNVKFFDAEKLGYRLLKNTTSSPSEIFFEITKKCNGLCTGCYADANANKWFQEEISFQEIQSIIKQFSELGGVYVRLTGGEPTCRKDFFDIINAINEEKLTIGLNTNGMFGEKTLEEILNRGIKDIRVSVDGPQEVNDNLRWKGNYHGAITTIANISEYNKTAEKPVRLTINVVLVKSNFDYIKPMIELAQNFHSEISFGLMRLSGRAKIKEQLSPQEVVQAAYRVQKMRETLMLPQGAVRINYDIFCEGMHDYKGRKLDRYTPFPFNNTKCPLGSSGFTVDAYARLVSCGYLVNVDNWIDEDIRGKNLLDVWYNSPLLNKIRHITRPECQGCVYYIKKCNGGCPAMAYFVNGKMDGIDPYCVKDVDVQEAISKVENNNKPKTTYHSKTLGVKS